MFVTGEHVAMVHVKSAPFLQSTMTTDRALSFFESTLAQFNSVNHRVRTRCLTVTPQQNEDVRRFLSNKTDGEIRHAALFEMYFKFLMATIVHPSVQSTDEKANIAKWLRLMEYHGCRMIQARTSVLCAIHH
jgi:hypothetical protein